MRRASHERMPNSARRHFQRAASAAMPMRARVRVRPTVHTRAQAPCAFAWPPIPVAPHALLSRVHQYARVALAALALSLPALPGLPGLPGLPAFRHGRAAHRTHVVLVATAPRSAVMLACHPVVIFDKDFSARPLPVWQLDLTAPSPAPVPAPVPVPAMPRPVRAGLPPSPSLAMEARILSRLLVALVVGGIIGIERRAANSLAGVRTFSLVSLGAAIFMSTSLAAFPSADATRVAAAISSSVGFLGAGAMHKTSKQSRGLTTASSVWLAAALGIAAAAGMFLLSFTGAVFTVLIARYARFDSSLHLIRRREEDAEDAFDRAAFEERRAVSDHTDDECVWGEDDDVDNADGNGNAAHTDFP